MFRIRKEADGWYDSLSTNEKNLFRTKFDLYYLLFLYGIMSKQKKSEPNSNDSTHDLIDYFPSEYDGAKFLIVGLLVITELDRLGVPVNDKKKVQLKYIELVDPESKAKLTSKGFSIMNDYASRGFELLKGKIGSKPELATEFLVNTYNLLKTNT